MEMKLYSYWRSSCSWRVRLVLALKSIPVEIIPIHLVKDGGEQHSESYIDINAMAQVPTLVTEDGLVLTQSVAIMSYLEERYPEPRMLPEDLQMRTICRQIIELIASGIQPLQNLSLLQQIDRWNGDRLSWGKEVIQTGLEAVEEIVVQTRNRFSVEGAFLFGRDPTLADCCLVPQLYNARRFGCDLSNLHWSIIAEKALLGLSQSECAHPNQQPDSQ